MKKFLQLLKKDERGLTLVELLAVIVILAIIGGIAFVAIGNITENTKKDAHIANAQQIISAVKLAEASGDVDLTTTNTISTDDSKLDPYIDELTSPWGDSDSAINDGEKYKGTVTKNETGEYSITMTGGNGSCALSATEAQINAGDRDSLCK